MESKKKTWIFSTKLLQFLLVFAVMYGFPVIVFAQTSFGTGSDITDTPIDGGVSLLVIAGVGYGVKKLYNKKYKK